MPTLTAAENAALPLDLARIGTWRERTAAAGRNLAAVGLAGRGSRLPLELSGGAQPRVASARASASRPPVLLGDEPTGNLDSGMATDMFRLLKNLPRHRPEPGPARRARPLPGVAAVSADLRYVTTTATAGGPQDIVIDGGSLATAPVNTVLLMSGRLPGPGEALADVADGQAAGYTVPPGGTLGVRAAGGATAALRVSGTGLNLAYTPGANSTGVPAFYTSAATAQALSGTRGYNHLGFRLTSDSPAAQDRVIAGTILGVAVAYLLARYFAERIVDVSLGFGISVPLVVASLVVGPALAVAAALPALRRALRKPVAETLTAAGTTASRTRHGASAPVPSTPTGSAPAAGSPMRTAPQRLPR